MNGVTVYVDFGKVNAIEAAAIEQKLTAEYPMLIFNYNTVNLYLEARNCADDLIWLGASHSGEDLIKQVEPLASVAAGRKIDIMMEIDWSLAFPNSEQLSA